MVTFLNINHPDELRSKETRFAVASHTHTRRGRRPRSIPIERKLAVRWSRPASSSPDDQESSSSASQTPENALQVPKYVPLRSRNSPKPPSPVTIEFSGTRQDPFRVYPIPVEGCVESAVDFWTKAWVPSQVPGMSFTLDPCPGDREN